MRESRRNAEGERGEGQRREVAVFCCLLLLLFQSAKFSGDAGRQFRGGGGGRSRVIHVSTAKHHVRGERPGEKPLRRNQHPYYTQPERSAATSLMISRKNYAYCSSSSSSSGFSSSSSFFFAFSSLRDPFPPPISFPLLSRNALAFKKYEGEKEKERRGCLERERKRRGGRQTFHDYHFLWTYYGGGGDGPAGGRGGTSDSQKRKKEREHENTSAAAATGKKKRNCRILDSGK